MMSLSSKRELLATVAPHYQKASGLQKEEILNQFVSATGFHRKYAISLLNHLPTARPAKQRRRPRVYQAQMLAPLAFLWKASNGLCSKRLVPFIHQVLPVLERFGEIHLEPAVRELLLRISPATADRLLKKERSRQGLRGLGATKPGTLLKHQIPVRTFADWDDAKPGFLEIDLVAHCGASAAGEFLHSLVLTDVCTGWTECFALLNKGQHCVTSGMVAAVGRLPFPILGIDCDNGAEFINHNLLRFCEERSITFTRCRPYRKNDQCHIEQKNWSIVRSLVGYDRYEGPVACQRLDALYGVSALYVNYFQPSLKLLSKERDGAKVKKHYDTARSPYLRLLSDDRVSEAAKERLTDQYAPLNPVALLRQLNRSQAQLWSLIPGTNRGPQNVR